MTSGDVVMDPSDWLYVVNVANRTQDSVQRNLLEIIARLTGRTIPLFPGVKQARAEQMGQAESAEKEDV